MDECKARMIWENEKYLAQVFGGKVRERAARMGIPAELLDRFEAEDLARLANKGGVGPSFR